MTNERREQSAAGILRNEAENRLARLEKITAGIDSDEIRELMHELQVHQIELEMQNAQLAQTQAELEKSRQKYADLFDFAPVGYISLDENGLVLEANLTVANLLGFERRLVVNRPFHFNVAAADRDLFRAHLQEIFRRGESGGCELRLKTKDGTLFYAQLTSLYVNADGKSSLSAAVMDISARRQAEGDLRRARDELEQRVQDRTAELEKANADLREVSSRLLIIQEEERKRIGIELHDSIGQTLSAIKFWIETILKLEEEGDHGSAMMHMGQFIPRLQGLIEETRNIYMGLRPPMLDTLGLLATIKWMCREFMRLYPRMHVELIIDITEEQIPQNLKISIFRITQESLNNAAKHSKTEWVDLSLIRSRDSIDVTIADAGIGMDPEYVARLPHQPNNIGLIGMRERAELTGGRFSIETATGQGFTVRVSWPIGG